MANAWFFLLVLLLWSPRGDGLREEAKDAVATGGELWCVAKNNAEDAALQSALDWACGPGGADCRPIQQGGACYQPEDIQSHASFAFNDYFLRNSLAASACDFSGTAALTSLNPSTSSSKNGSFSGSAASSLGPAAADMSGVSPLRLRTWSLASTVVSLALATTGGIVFW
ncbi:hypothetical protein B296_00039591 [Ensete ventricosum]|uniref:X8 domain-containing protein n=1 Tax=Ensete ventricosum TaxID=4639 RepID=A0A426ZJA2_ENSVE|nr:hypothetical protein B296_00039591 [Ensete ventricosum]